MKHLHTFESYLNENTSLLNEGEKFVTDDRFKDEASLKADIIKNAGPALKTFLKDQGVDWPTDFEITEQSNRLKLTSKPVTGDALGIMQYGFVEVYLTFFNGGSLPKINKSADGIEFQPSIWTNLNYSYKHAGGGSNGCNLYLPASKSADIWYDVVNAKWLDRLEAQKAGF